MLLHLSWKKGAQHLLKCKQQFKIPLRLTTASVNLPKEQTGERDLINFPRLKRLEYPIETRLLLPKSWFDAFYNKTGVTGPYMLIGGIATYVLSKEIIVLTPDVFTVAATLSLYPVFEYFLKGNLLPYLTKEYEIAKEKYDAPKKDIMSSLEESIAVNNDKKREMEGIVLYLPNVKRENVYLQMEAAYRQQLQEAYKNVKTRLDYHIERQNVERRIAQKNMVDWIIRHVMKSITPQHMNNALKQSIADIKNLTIKN